MAHDAGIPVIAYDRIIRDSDLDLYVSFDNERVGELQAQFLVDHLPTPGKGRIVRIYGAKTDNNAAQFKRGPGPRARAADQERRHRGGARRLGRGLEARERQAHRQRGDHGQRPAHRRRAREQRRHRGRRDPGAERGGPRRQGAGHRPGRRNGGAAAHRRGHPGDDHLQAAAHAGAAAPRNSPCRWQQRRVVVARQSVDNGHGLVPSVLFDVVTVTRDNILETVVRDGQATYDDVYRGIPDARRPPRP